MDKPIIRLVVDECGDWQILKVNDEVYYENHSIPSFIWLDLLIELGFDAKRSLVVYNTNDKGLIIETKFDDGSRFDDGCKFQ